MHDVPIRRALVSVSDKSNLSELASALADRGVEIVSTGGTGSFLQEAGFPVTDIQEVTGFPEILDGRVKTLHPAVFGGLLARRDRESDLAAIHGQGIAEFELVVVNLYPFVETIARPDVDEAEAIEKIDIGGPSLVRAAAKNHRFVAVATAPSQYPQLIAAIREQGGTDLPLRRALAAAAFEYTARYDRAIADYFAREEADGEDFPETVVWDGRRQATLRYGENPHQRAALYVDPRRRQGTVVAAEQLHGKELSYNNLLDLDSAWRMARLFREPAAVVIKHNNPCGAAVADPLSTALEKALAGDPVSAFGSILAVNRPLDAAAARVLCAPGLFIEAIIAPEFATEARSLLTSEPKWRQNVRLLEIGTAADPPRHSVRQIDGGWLVQTADLAADEPRAWQCVTETAPDDALAAELEFAWAACRHVTSNAILLAKDQALVGVGAGQMSRVDSVQIAIRKAGERAEGSVLASDAFFPFPDSIHLAAEAGVRAVIQPGGSKRDKEVIAACNQHGLPMLLTGARHFRH